MAGRVGYARRCAPHQHAAQIQAGRKHTALNLEERRRSSRRNYQKNAARRAAKNEYKRAWRKANRDKVRAQKRREALTPNDRRVAYHAARRAREREALAARERARHHGVTELRTCVTPGCDIVLTGRKKKCMKCKAREAAAASAVLAAHAGRGRRTDLECVA